MLMTSPTFVLAPGRGITRCQDFHKGAVEDDRPSERTNALALDDDGMPNDETAIAQDALGAAVDRSQG